MVRRRLIWFVPVLLAVGALAATQYAVQLRSAKLRKSPQFLGPIVGTLSYGDPVEKLEEQGSWQKVRTASGKQGWLHATAIAKAKKVEAGEKKAGTDASSHEVSLAGKGFNEQVEQKYASEHAELNFKLVDRMEKTRSPESEIRSFAQQGGLLKGGA